MKTTEFQKLLDLVTHDQSIHSLKHSIKKNALEKDAIQKNIDDVSEPIKNLEAECLDVTKQLSAAELDLESLYEKEDALQKQSEQIQDYKQYQALTKEIESLQKEKDAKEQELMNLTHKKSNLEKQIAKEKIAVEQKVVDFSKEIEEIATQLDVIQKQYDEALSLRNTFLKDVPEEWLEMYVSMSESVTNPIVAIINDSCGGCFYPITQVLLSQAKKNALVRCQNCCRIMYISH